MKDDISKKQTEACTSCRIARTIIRDFFHVMDNGLENSPEEWKRLFAFFKEPMGTAEEDEKILKRFFLCEWPYEEMDEKNAEKKEGNPKEPKKDPVGTEIARNRKNLSEKNMALNKALITGTVHEECLWQLQKIITSMYYLIDEEKLGREHFTKDSDRVFRAICERLGEDTYRDFGTWKKKIIEEDDNKGKDSRKALETIENILQEFIDLNPEREINNMAECYFKVYFPLQQKLQMKSNQCTELSCKAKKLNDNHWRIFEKFVTRAPKQFGYNLAHIMAWKDLSEQDIVNLLPKGIKVTTSNIQSLKECMVPGLDKETITLIARALLVDTSVLYCGYGYSYGNWKNVIPDSKEEGYDAVCRLTGSKKVKENQEIVLEEIHKIIESSEKLEEFLHKLEENPVEGLDFHKERAHMFESLEEQLSICNDLASIENLIAVLEEIETEV